MVWAGPDDDPGAAPQLKKVLKVFKNFSAVIRVHVGGRVIRTTPEHRFFTQQRGWGSAKELQPGDLFRNRMGPWMQVEKVEDLGEETEVYNLRIADFHTYFVGGLEWGFSVWRIIRTSVVLGT